MDRIEITTASDELDKDVETLIDALTKFNEEAVGPLTPVPLVVFARDREGRVVGGAKGKTGWRWFHLELLWVSEDLRGKGLGRELVQEAEEEARRRGCVAVYTDSFDFQAPEFYRSLGYEQYGLLEDFPVGSRRHYFTKRL